MLYLNGEKLEKLSKSQEDALFKFLGKKKGEKFDVTIKYPQEAYSQPREKGGGKLINPKPDCPAIVPITYKAIISGDNGSEEWVYCETTKMKPGTIELIYSPTALLLDKSLKIPSNQLDKLFFLCMVSPLRKGSPHASDGGRPMFVIENKSEEAKNRIGTKALRAQAIVAITSTLQLDKLRIIATSLDIQNVHIMEKEEIEDVLTTYVETEQGLKNFNKKANLEEDTILRSLVNECVDRKIIVFNNSNNSWHYAGTEGKKGELITKLIAGKDRIDTMVFFLENDSSEQERLESALANAKILETVEE